MEILKLALLVSLLKCIQCFNDTSYGDEESRVLSRRKRFLVFPEGSSFQLVFCVQTSALIPIGDIFLFGQTAAIAWSLPTDPTLFQMFKGEKVAQRREDAQKNIYYLDQQGKLIAKVPYKSSPLEAAPGPKPPPHYLDSRPFWMTASWLKRTPIINPVFAKRSIDDELSYKDKLKQLKIDRMKMHEEQLKKDFLKKHHLDKNSIDFHRNSRLDLYEKLESFFRALGQDGRQCLLHKLCKAGQSYTKQGTFLQEMFRAIFTLPKGFEDEEYDEAHSATKDCDKLYVCEDFSDSVEI